MAVIRIRISDLMQNLTHSVDLCELYAPVDWANFLMQKCSTELIGLMMRHGQEKPIRIYCNDDVGIYRYRCGWELGNGHHRLAAAILLGWDTILVEDGQYGDYDEEHLDDWEATDSTYDENGYECTDGPEGDNGWLWNHMDDLCREVLAQSCVVWN